MTSGRSCDNVVADLEQALRALDTRGRLSKVSQVGLDANSLDNISNAHRVHRVVKGGVVYDREGLLKPLVCKID